MVMLTPFGMACIVATAVVFAAAGWFCIFRTHKLVALARRNYEKSKLLRSYPFSDFVLKDSYPTYLRCAGIFVWLTMAGVVYLLIFGHSW